MLVLALVIAGCGDKGPQKREALPTLRPTETATPRSSPLPPVDPAPALGEEGREIEIQFVGDAEPNLALQNKANALARQLEAGVDDMQFAVFFADERTALNALCSGAPYAAWVSAFSYLTIETQCNVVPVLAVQRGEVPDVTIGRSADIITRIDVDDLSQLAGRIFCRSLEHDIFTTWVFPSLLMTAEGFDPMTQLGGVQDYPDDLTLARALYEGDCAGAALPPGVFREVIIELAPRLGTVQDRVTTDEIMDYVQILKPAGATALPIGTVRWTGYATNVIPYEVLVFAPETVIPAETRDEIVAVMEDFFADPDNGEERLADLLDASAVIPVEANHYAAVRTLVTNARWDMTFAN